METAMFRFLSRTIRTNPDRVRHIDARRTLAALDEALLRDIGVERPHSRHQTMRHFTFG
jgi:uncharacterized protein YjiS (DUF1127 family)